MEMPPAVPTDSYSTAREFVGALQLSDHWVQKARWSSPWVFRGQQDASWSLTPSAWRSGSTPALRRLDALRAEILARSGVGVASAINARHGAEGANGQQVAHAYAQALAEFSLILEFVETADALGHSVPGMDQYKRLKNHDWFPDLGSYPNLRLLPEPNAATALAQHHGIPTRCLDWSRNPFVAAFFAAHGIEQAAENQEIAVWAVRPDQLYWHTERTASPENYQRYLVHEAPRGENEFLQAQDALFLHPVTACAHYSKHGAWPKLEDLALQVGAYYSAPVIRKLTLPASQVGELLRLLWLQGVSKAHLMPTYDNVTSGLVLKWRWSE